MLNLSNHCDPDRWPAADSRGAADCESSEVVSDAGIIAVDREKCGRPLQKGGETILVVEDDDEMRDLTVLMLRKLGYRTLAAVDATDGLSLLEAHPEVSLLLTDMRLPGGISGRVLAERARLARPTLKIVHMSGFTLEALSTEGSWRAGARFLEKPFKARALAKEVREALDHD